MSKSRYLTLAWTPPDGVRGANYASTRGTVDVVERCGSSEEDYAIRAHELSHYFFSSPEIESGGRHNPKRFEEIKTTLFVMAVQLMVRDRIPPLAVHSAMLEFVEYLDGCSDDMPEVSRLR